MDGSIDNVCQVYRAVVTCHGACSFCPVSWPSVWNMLLDYMEDPALSVHAVYMKLPLCYLPTSVLQSSEPLYYVNFLRVVLLMYCI